ncbi:MAG: MBL fold metallo-hydrolase [Clostridia bacterium]|nr:MBL fold metallo-hydrolase [Clostridia bacterium]
MKILKIPSRQGWCNSFLLYDNGKGVLIDCASASVFNVCKEAGVEVCAVLLTHGHFDHVGGCKAFYDAGVPIYCGEKEKDLIFSKEYLGIFGGVYVPEFKIARTLKDGEKFEICGVEFEVMLMPGHTAGSICYKTDRAIFTGDTLFAGSIGRCDLPTGNAQELKNSLKKLNKIDRNYILYCGHGEDTTLDREKKFNPYLREL